MFMDEVPSTRALYLDSLAQNSRCILANLFRSATVLGSMRSQFKFIRVDQSVHGGLPIVMRGFSSITFLAALFLISVRVKSHGLPCSSFLQMSNAQPAFNHIILAASVTLGTE